LVFEPVVGMILVFDDVFPLDVFRWEIVVEGIIYRVFSREPIRVF
jgi:hypothetical protein